MINPPSWRMRRQWIVDDLIKAEKRPIDLARALGRDASWMSKVINGHLGLQDSMAARIREYLAKFIPGYAELQSGSEMRIPESSANVPFRTEMPRDVPILGKALGGPPGGEISMSIDTGLRARRPPKYAGRDDIFALYMQGDSMGPRYPSGELIFLEAKRPPVVGDHVVVEFVDGSDAVVRLLEAMPVGKYRLAQYKPSQSYEIDRTDVLRLIRVLTTYDLLG